MALAALTTWLILAGPAGSFGTPEMIPLATPLTRAGYERIGHEHGVTVYRQMDADIIQIAAEGRIEAAPRAVQRVLLDYERHVGRVDRVSESRVLRRGDGHLLVYQRLNLPVISDRDFYLSVRWGERDGVRWIHYRACLPDAPVRAGVVRVHHHRGSWQLKPLDGGRATWARYQSNIDLAGMLPRWIARSSVGDEVPGLFVALRRMVAECDPGPK